MKIAIIGQKGIPAIMGGVETHVEELAVQLAASGHDVYVYTRRNYTDKNLRHYKGVNLVSLPNIPTKHLDAISHTFLACLDVWRRNVDIVHFHSIGPSLLIWLVKLLKPHTPVVATFHTLCYEHKKWGKFARISLMLGEWLCCNTSDRLITISEGLKDFTWRKYGRKSACIPNGFKIPKYLEADEIVARWGLKKDSYIFLATRLIQHKGVHYAIEAFKNIKTDKKLVIAGDGFFTDGYVEELHALSAEDDRIIFTGRQSGDALAELFSNAYLFIQPSESEGLSISLLEAMSYSIGVLVSDIPENMEAIAGAGFAFRNMNVDSLQKKMEYLLAHPEEVKEFGVYGKTRVFKHFNWNTIAKEVIEVYGMAINDRKQAVRQKVLVRAEAKA